MPYHVYRFMDSESNVLYIGKTKQRISRRMQSHFCKNGHLGEDCYNSIGKIEFMTLDSQAEMDIAEIYYINKYQPSFNTMNKYNEELSIEFQEKPWSHYDEKVLTQSESVEKTSLRVDFIDAVVEILDRSENQNKKSKMLNIDLCYRYFEDFYELEYTLSEMIYRFTRTFVSSQVPQVTTELQNKSNIDEIIVRCESEKKLFREQYTKEFRGA